MSWWSVPYSTFAGVVCCLAEARFTGAEGVGAVGDTVSLVSIPTQSPVTPTVVQLGVCRGRQRTTLFDYRVSIPSEKSG